MFSWVVLICAAVCDPISSIYGAFKTTHLLQAINMYYGNINAHAKVITTLEVSFQLFPL